MKIEELISGKGDNDRIEIEGISLPVRTLKNITKEGYIHLKPEPRSKTVTLWGTTCCACLTEEQLRERG
jgi:hypothetical protein